MNWITEIILEHNRKEAEKIAFDNLAIDTPEKEAGMERLIYDILRCEDD